MNGHFKFGGDPLRRSREIRARVEAGSIGKKSRRPKTALEDDDTSTVPLDRNRRALSHNR